MHSNYLNSICDNSNTYVIAIHFNTVPNYYKLNANLHFLFHNDHLDRDAFILIGSAGSNKLTIIWKKLHDNCPSIKQSIISLIFTDGWFDKMKKVYQFYTLWTVTEHQTKISKLKAAYFFAAKFHCNAFFSHKKQLKNCIYLIYGRWSHYFWSNDEKCSRSSENTFLHMFLHF